MSAIVLEDMHCIDMPIGAQKEDNAAGWETSTEDGQETVGTTGSYSLCSPEPRALSECKQRIRCCGFGILVFFVLLLWAFGGFYAIFFVRWPPRPIAACGDCHCSVAKGSQCPAWVPVTDYSSETAKSLASQVPLNAYSLSCNPYNDEDYKNDADFEPCTTDPPQRVKGTSEELVCGFQYERQDPPAKNGMGARYTLETYTNRTTAEAAGAVVSHAGACGVCSTAQDLAAYIRSSDLTTEGKYCSYQGLLNFDWGVECYQDLGFTEACATMWIYNGYHTKNSCLFTCLKNMFAENNGPPDECQLNECLQCDEDHSGPLFKEFAGRTRRRSGLLSAIVRPCDALHDITHHDYPEWLKV